MSETVHHADDAHAAAHHDHGGLGKYVAVFLALCVLTSASFFTYSDYWPFHETPAVGWTFMMAVSCTKALLVMLFFMHLMWEANWKYVLTIPAMFMSLFLVLMLVPDIGLRARHYSEEREAHIAVQADAAVDEEFLEEEEHASGAAEPADEAAPADGDAAPAAEAAQ